MKRLALALAGVLSVAFGGAPATAADMPVKSPVTAAAPVAPVWTGFYAGISGGWLRADTQWSQFGSAKFSDSGWLIGATAGANWQTGLWVLGVEGDISKTNAGPRLDPPSCTPTCSQDVDWLGTLRLRAGVTVTPAWLLYGTGGLAVGGIHDFAPGFVSVHDTKVGWTAGVGTEVMLAPHWSVKAEYLYADFGSTTVCGAPLCATPATADYVHAHIARAGLNYHF